MEWTQVIEKIGISLTGMLGLAYFIVKVLYPQMVAQQKQFTSFLEQQLQQSNRALHEVTAAFERSVDKMDENMSKIIDEMHTTPERTARLIRDQKKD